MDAETGVVCKETGLWTQRQGLCVKRQGCGCRERVMGTESRVTLCYFWWMSCASCLDQALGNMDFLWIKKLILWEKRRGYGEENLGL